MLLEGLQRRMIHGRVYFILYWLIELLVKGIFVDIQMLVHEFLLSLDHLPASSVYSGFTQVCINVLSVVLFLTLEVGSAEAKAHTRVNGSG